jgi:hypothetical protein
VTRRDDRGLPATTVDVVLAGVDRVRADPGLLVPFTLAGAVLAVLDWLAARDPVPVVRTPPFPEQVLSVSYLPYPVGVAAVLRPVGAFVGLRPAYAVWLAAAAVVGLAAASVPTAYGLARAAGWAPDRAALARYVGFVALARLVLGVSYLRVDLPLLLGVPVILVVLAAYARLFALPGLLLAGRDARDALATSARVGRGVGWRFAGAVVVLGLARHVVTGLPGPAPLATLVSTAVVGTVHAGAVADVVRAWEAGDGPGRGATTGDAPTDRGGTTAPSTEP